MKALIDSYTAEISGGDINGIIINTSGCGSTLKNYGHHFRDDPDYREKAEAVSALAKDISEFITEEDIRSVATKEPKRQRIVYHSPCSLTHAQRITDKPPALLRAAGFEVREAAEQGLCCGSAGTYNILEGEIADSLKARKVAVLNTQAPDMIASGNLGCMIQLEDGLNCPIVHTVELLDWATGGPKPC
jgi:glycolate oxidase iron-sulfur subunit